MISYLNVNKKYLNKLKRVDEISTWPFPYPNFYRGGISRVIK
jgi:hypothetical protein